MAEPPFNSDQKKLTTTEDRIYEVLRRVGMCLNVPMDKTEVDLGDVSPAVREEDEFSLLVAGAKQTGVLIKETEGLTYDELQGLISEGFPVILAKGDQQFWVFENRVGKRYEAGIVAGSVSLSLLRRGQIQALLRPSDDLRTFVAKRQLECHTLSGVDGAGHAGGSGHDQGHAHDHHGPPPLRRFLALLRLDQRDIWTMTLFAGVAGILALATPLAIESLVNVVSWGTYIQPLLVLAVMLLACLGIAGILKILQTFVVEIIQRRQLVRIVGDLAHRFPRANQASLEGQYPRELANRVFDIMTIQKASSVLLLDGVSIVLTTILGLLLLAFYHPFLLGFDIVLIISMISITWLLGRGGVDSAIEESITKYRIAHWLQDVLSMPSAFKINGGEMLAVERANRLTSDYVVARQKQFRVVIRQVAFAIGLQVIASTALLGLGGWLVIRQQLTLGQLVASELVVTTVVGAFAKAGKSLEKFYDLMAGMDKVGHLLDIPVDPRFELGDLPPGPAGARWEELGFHTASHSAACTVPAAEIPPGAKVAIHGKNRSGKSLLLKALGGLVKPHYGLAEIAGFDAQRAALAGQGSLVGYAGAIEIFHSTLLENVDLGRNAVGQNRVRESLASVGLWDDVLRLPEGLTTKLQTNGYPLSRTQQVQLTIARAIASHPRLLLIDGLLDDLDGHVREELWQALSGDDTPWTLLLVTNNPELIERCDAQLDTTNSSTGHP